MNKKYLSITFSLSYTVDLFISAVRLLWVSMFHLLTSSCIFKAHHNSSMLPKPFFNCLIKSISLINFQLKSLLSIFAYVYITLHSLALDHSISPSINIYSVLLRQPDAVIMPTYLFVGSWKIGFLSFLVSHGKLSPSCHMLVGTEFI